MTMYNVILDIKH